MVKSLITLLFLLFLPGCIIINSAPKDNQEFTKATGVQEFNGTYRNLGEPATLYLSQLVLTNRTVSSRNDPLVEDMRGNLVQESYITNIFGSKTRDKEIELIEVESDGKTLTVKAIKDQCIISSKEYLFGRDFTFSDGKVILKKEFHALTRGPGDVIVGPSYEKVELGIDVAGHGKYKSQGYFAGMVFMLFPMAAGGADEVKFEKIDSTRIFELCK